MTFNAKRFLTLIELMIVLTIIALVGGLIGINITTAVKAQRFRTEVDMMVDTLRLAQDLMLIMGADVHVRVATEQAGKGIEYWVEVEGGVPKQWESVIKRTRRLLVETHGIAFLEQRPFPIISGQLDLRFQSNGTMMSQGVLRMSTHEQMEAAGALKRDICLPGYPHPIVSVVEKDKPVECWGQDTDIDRSLTLYTVQEVTKGETNG